MSRKPTLEDTFLLALLDAGIDGLNATKWYTINKPSEYKESYNDFTKMIDSLNEKKLIDYTNFLDHWKLTEKGKERTHTIEGEIGLEEYISLITRVSPKEELRKRIQNTETFIVSIFFTWASFIELQNLKNLTTLSPDIILVILIIFLIIFVIGLIYSISSFSQIATFWAYYSVIHGKTRKRIFVFYKENEKYINVIFKYIFLPIIILLITIYGLDLSVKYAIGTLIITIFGQYMSPKSKS